MVTPFLLSLELVVIFFNKMYGEGMVRVFVWEEGRMFCFLMNDDYLYK